MQHPSVILHLFKSQRENGGHNDIETPTRALTHGEKELVTVTINPSEETERPDCCSWVCLYFIVFLALAIYHILSPAEMTY